MFSKTLVITALIGLLFALTGTATHAQTSNTWTLGTAYLDTTNPANSFAISTTGGNTGRHNSIVTTPNPTFILNSGYVPGLPQGGNDSSGAGPVFQPYIWNGGSVQSNLNFTANIGAAASGRGSYQSNIDIHINTTYGTFPAGGAAPPAYSGSNSFTVSNAASPGLGIGTLVGNVYVIAVHISGDARMQGSDSSAHAGAYAVFGNPT